MTVTIWHAARSAISRRVSELISLVRRRHEGEALPRLRAVPLAPFERGGLQAALRRAGLPCDNVERFGPLTWRFDTDEDIPAGFGGLEIRGPDALLHSVVTLPPLRGEGFGRAIVAAIEQEAQLFACDAMYLLTTEPSFFARLGYTVCSRSAVPEEVLASSHFESQVSQAAEIMVKPLVST